LLLLAALAPFAIGQEAAPVAQREPLGDLFAATYPEDRGAEVVFSSTFRLPLGKGKAQVRRRRGLTDVEISLSEMKSALLFSGDYNTYVAWAVSPEGLVDNLGELILRGDNSRLNATTVFSTFGLFISAEPHFLVEKPSTFVVLKSAGMGSAGAGQTVAIPFPELITDYKFDRESLADQEQTKGEFRVDRQQAQVAVILAERSAAREFAPAELEEARKSLSETILSLADKNSDERTTLLARRTVNLAVRSEQLGRQRAEADRLAKLEESLADAQKRAAEAEKAREAAEAAAEKSQKAAQEAEQETGIAELKMQNALDRADRLQQRAADVEAFNRKLDDERRTIQQERDAAHTRMQDALAKVVETRETARGLVLNLPDILFDTGRSRLKPEAREVLSKVVGILMVAPGYKLRVEGHTDSTGRPALNQKLSEERAISVFTYLAESGIAEDAMTPAGYGETQPIESNQNEAGRQKNRRVEIIIQDLGGVAPVPPTTPADGTVPAEAAPAPPPPEASPATAPAP
jgi:outer membrane protein OmpA-like peptidoglycan-associated protein